MVKSSKFISNEIIKVISYHISRVSIGMLAATGVAALGGLALQQLGGVGGLSSGVQGLLSQENSGPQIATRFQKSIISGCVKANIFRRVEEWTRPNWE